MPPSSPPATDLEQLRSAIRQSDDRLLHTLARLALLPPDAFPAPPPWPDSPPAPPIAKLFSTLSFTMTRALKTAAPNVPQNDAPSSPPHVLAAECLAALRDRAAAARLIAEAKLRLQPDDFREAIEHNDPERILFLLTDIPVEIRLMQRLAHLVETEVIPLPADLIQHLWVELLIPWTKQVERAHLMEIAP